MAKPIDRGTETREQWLGRAIEMMRPEFAAAGAPLPENLAVLQLAQRQPADGDR
ncbi:hypothetical protein [Candidatus Nephthysia bennettiae]|uniref:Uncharacterized protein n=1 Tax=Candidatus Nephthysia bennettiae TaxID=3127016 RepID=A0A934K997_9BACT|nr:hypothetical protein [Candidatus Dormibacteraeota bacterium]MBJ7607712.1 hypothetical protein [Candidatus Dormibacteraeota bacterium]MBJ7612603.1 hypothetical protein [Candidatus Dormibacteraeota bacterium]